MDKEFIARLEICAEIAGSVASLARKAGISQSGIRKYFQGTEPTRPILLALSSAVDISPLWLTCGRGSVCDFESAPMLAAKQQLARNFSFARQTNDFLNLALKDAADLYCDEYNNCVHRGELPNWVPAVIPKLSWDELTDWSRGNFTTQPNCLQTNTSVVGKGTFDDWLQGPTELVVAVIRELPVALGEAYQNLDRKKESHIVQSVVDFLKQMQGNAQQELLRPELLHTQIRITAYIYDQQKNGQPGGGSEIKFNPGDY